MKMIEMKPGTFARISSGPAAQDNIVVVRNHYGSSGGWVTVSPQAAAGYTYSVPSAEKLDVEPVSGYESLRAQAIAAEDEANGHVSETLRLKEALRLSTVQLKDLANGWPEKELHEPLEVTLERNREFVPEAFEDY